MSSEKRPFEVKKTFGLSVLLKLTRKSIPGIEISEKMGKYTSNVSFEELDKAVNMTMRAHNISLQFK